MKRISIIGRKSQSEKEQFLEILLQERYVGEGILISKEDLRKVGGVNTRIVAKKDYELLLRLAKNYSLLIMDDGEEDAEDDICVLPDFADNILESLKTDCYIIGKYKEELLAEEMFNAAVENILCVANDIGQTQEIVSYLEQMIARTDAYFALDDVTRPILIYKGSNVCHNVLNVFAEAFGEALEAEGQCVEYYDIESRPIGEIIQLVGKRYRAIVGVQTYAFTIMMKDGSTCLHNLIGGKKYNFVFDHPIWLMPHLQHEVQDFYVLTHDWNYQKFVQHYYGKESYLLPPAGLGADELAENAESKIYDISFVGTYGDYKNEVYLIHAMERKQRFLANHFLRIMRKNPNLTAEQALHKTLQEREMCLSDQAFLEQFYLLRRVVYCVMHYYRHLVLEEILKAGIKLDVFGDSWQVCPLKKYPNLRCHPNVTVEESLAIWRQSRISLNIMSWHKAGFTERIANSMLAGAVVVTDQSAYLNRNFVDGEDIVLFDLEDISAVSEKIKQVLEEESLREQIACKAAEKARKEHTWRARAKEFLEVLE